MWGIIITQIIQMKNRFEEKVLPQPEAAWEGTHPKPKGQHGSLVDKYHDGS